MQRLYRKRTRIHPVRLVEINPQFAHLALHLVILYF